MEYFSNPFLIASFLAQGFCIYHVIKHHKPWWWILFILVFPFFGCFYYFLREVRGTSSSSHMKRRMVNLNPGKEPASRRMIADLESQLEISDTVGVRLKLAEANFELGYYNQAVSYYLSCLKGYHKDDPVVLFGLSQALFADGKPAECLEHLQHLDATGRNDYRNERLLLKARALAAQGKDNEAISAFDEASNRLPGEEARCYYAQLLMKVGSEDKAQELFKRILRNAEQGDKDYRARNQEWIAVAKREFKG